MKTLDEIKTDISKLGVTRIEIQNHPPMDKMIEHFYEIMRDMLERYGKELDEKAVADTVKFIVEWSYMTGDDINYQKGFILNGLTGRGKTFLFRAWQYWLRLDNFIYVQDGKTKPVNPHIINVKKISGEYQDPDTGGYRVLDHYSRTPCLVLDDIGKEDEFSRSYGNKVNIIEEIISLREERDLLTFATTNLTKLSQLYDDRTISRMNRLFTFVPVKHNKDFRLN